MTRFMLIAVAAFSLSLSTIGCGSKAADCNKLIESINNDKPDFEKARELGDIGEAVAEFEKLATGVKEFSDKLAALDLKDETVAKHRDDYKKMLDASATELKGAAQALEAMKSKPDPVKLKRVAAGFEAVQKKENQLVTSINGYCGG